MLWGGYTVKILISGTTKQEQHLTTWQHLWVPQKHLGACVVLAVVSFQLRHLITPSPKSERHRWFVWALLSPLLSPSQKIARDPDVDSLEAGGSRTQSSSFANRFGLAFVTFSRWWGGRGRTGVCQDWVCSSPWCAGRTSRAQMCFVNQSKLSCCSCPWQIKGQGHGAHTESEHPWNYSRPWNLLHVCCASTHFQTVRNISTEQCEPCALPIAMTCH